MIISEDYSQMAVKSVVHEASGDWGNVDDDELTIPFDYQPYNVTSDLKGNQTQNYCKDCQSPGVEILLYKSNKLKKF